MHHDSKLRSSNYSGIDWVISNRNHAIDLQLCIAALYKLNEIGVITLKTYIKQNHCNYIPDTT